VGGTGKPGESGDRAPIPRSSACGSVMVGAHLERATLSAEAFPVKSIPYDEEASCTASRKVVAVRALSDPEYHEERYAEAQGLRESLAEGLGILGWAVLPGVANLLLCQLPGGGLRTSALLERGRKEGLYLRAPGSVGSAPTAKLLWVAVKDVEGNRHIEEILGMVVSVSAWWHQLRRCVIRVRPKCDVLDRWLDTRSFPHGMDPWRSRGMDVS